LSDGCYYFKITYGSVDNVVQGNRIGTDVTGTAPLPNGTGLFLDDHGSGNTVGGTGAGAGNLISGNIDFGMFLSGSANVVQGNRVGTDATGTAPLPNGTGAYLTGSDNTVGGAAAGAGNTIAFNAGDGVWVDAGTGNTIRSNAIFGNGRYGIELTDGGNNGQAAPALSSATSSDGLVTGTLSAAPSATYTLDFYVSDPNDPNQGQRFLGSLSVTTDASGAVTFTSPALAGLLPGQYVTATATDSLGNTSAFSLGVLVS
jgi:parallel beta-helix repeat protein